jgi:hypothetical protein
VTYNIRDVIGFPPPSDPTKTIDWQSICDNLDRSRELPVVYSFGGNAPTTVNMVNGLMSSMNEMGQSSRFGTRIFVEYTPYYWMPSSPDWNGQ